jgi:hypothetical protein
MARISIYGLDINLSLLDKWIGTDSNGGSTKNFTAQAIADLFNSVGAISISGQNNFKFQSDSSIGRRQGTISFENFNGNNTDFADITELKISKKSSSTKDVHIFMAELVGGNIIIAHCNEPNNFGIYKLLSYEEDPLELGYYVMEMEFIAANGSIIADEFYGVAVYPGALSQPDKFYTHVQTIPAVEWEVQHDLEKYPSVTVTLPSGQVGMADVQYIDNNNLIITFAGEETGKAYMN